MAERDPQTYAIIGAAMEVHGILGPYYLEAVYQDALEVELGASKIPFRREVPVHVRYKGTTLSAIYRVDFVCFDDVVVELKAIKALGVREDSQVLNYLAAMKLGRALLLNFASPRLTYQRFVLTEPLAKANRR